MLNFQNNAEIIKVNWFLTGVLFVLGLINKGYLGEMKKVN